MSRLDRWFAEDPPRSPAEYACALARDRFWRDERARLIGTHPDFPDVAHLLGAGEEIAHALVLTLSRLPLHDRLSFASAFFDERPGEEDRRSRERESVDVLQLAAGAELALLVVDLVATPALRNERILDLLQGAAQGDDLTVTPAPSVEFLRKTIARVLADLSVEDDADPHAAAALAVVEVLDPSSESVDLKEVLARAAYATVECRGRAGAFGFLLVADRVVTGAVWPTW